MAFKVGQEHVDIVRNWAQFDAAWYLDEYPDVGLAAMDPAYHYLWLGQRIGRRPSAQFDDFSGRAMDPAQLLRLIQEDRPRDIHARERIEGHYRPRPDCPAEFMATGEASPDELSGLSVAVHAHMYYADLADEFAAYLGRMPCRFDLYVSTPDEKARAHVTAVFSRISNCANLDVRIVPNIGRDIAPFVVEFGPILAGYDVVCHIQTKKSLYNNGATDGWREYILDALFRSPGRITFLLRALKQSQYGIVYPQCFFNLPYLAHTWLANQGLARAWAPRFGVETVPDGYFDFPAGSMFWARGEALRPLLQAGLRWEDFPPEQRQTDGTLAHCIERMLGVVPTARKFQHGVITDFQYPSWSRWRINQYLDRPLDIIHAAIADDTVKVVAFDIFDTLLVRHLLDPDYAKKALDLRCEAAGMRGFRELRMRCEAEARDAKGKDVDIHEIYAALQKHPAFGSGAISVEDEAALEIASVRPRKEIVDLLRFAIDRGKRVVLASDMFLARPMIEEMLRRCGVSGWKALYLSSEIGVRKDSGAMYDHILREERIDPQDFLMIGDNERSDFQIPFDKGMRALHAMKPVNIMRATPRLETVVPAAETASPGDQFLFGALAAENFSGLSFPGFSADNMFGSSPRAIGYGLLGPLMLAFSQWLAEEARTAKIDRLYFLSREGKVMKAAYDVWAEGLGLKTTAHYLFVSRRAVTVPCIASLDDIHHIARSNNFYGESLEMFLKERYGVELSETWWADLKARGLWDRGRALTIIDGNIEPIIPLLDFLSPAIFEQAKAERASALRYFGDMEVMAEGSSAVVDIGYGGTIQRHLNKLLNRKLHGLYMMTNWIGEAWGQSAGVVMKGCFVSSMPGDRDRPSPMFAKSFLLERMLSANDEQLLSYDERGEPIFRTMLDYVEAGRAVRDAMQQGAIDFVKDAVAFRDTISKDMAVSPGRAQDLYDRFVADMSHDEKRVFETLALDDFYCGRGVVTE
ncbi:hypothetical protein DMC47_43710 [Nostoc sp. 3335mG]|nr:hypothetical protein DMC47_43710 [Nostoc sp. 3335mG]